MSNPTGWVTNLVIIEKPNKLVRVCLDPINLNKVIIRDYSLIPTLEEIIPKLKGQHLFTALDLKEGFHNIINLIIYEGFQYLMVCLNFCYFPLELKVLRKYLKKITR